MSRGATAVANGKQLVRQVVAYARSAGLVVQVEVACGRRLFGPQRHIDILIKQPGGTPLGIECKWQGQSGSAEEKVLATLQDIDIWPFPGVLVYDGPGFSKGMQDYLKRHKLAVHLRQLPYKIDEYFATGILPMPFVDEKTCCQDELF